jgi:hypothetical protein
METLIGKLDFLRIRGTKSNERERALNLPGSVDAGAAK